MQSNRRKLEKELSQLIDIAYEKEIKKYISDSGLRIKPSELQPMLLSPLSDYRLSALAQFKKCPNLNSDYPCSGLYSLTSNQFDILKTILFENNSIETIENKYKSILTYYHPNTISSNPFALENIAKNIYAEKPAHKNELHDELYQLIQNEDNAFSGLEDVPLERFSQIQSRFHDKKYEFIFDYYYLILLKKNFPRELNENRIKMNYHFAVLNFKSVINDKNREICTELLNAIENQASPANNPTSAQLSVLTDILISAREGIENPTNIKNQEKFGHLLKKVNGEPSYKRHLLGAMLIFFGVFCLSLEVLGMVAAVLINPGVILGALPLLLVGGYCISKGVSLIKKSKIENAERKELICPLAQNACTYFYNNLKEQTHKNQQPLQPQIVSQRASAN